MSAISIRRFQIKKHRACRLAMLTACIKLTAQLANPRGTRYKLVLIYRPRTRGEKNEMLRVDLRKLSDFQGNCLESNPTPTNLQAGIFTNFTNFTKVSLPVSLPTRLVL
jgi:hypothetical protein